MPVNKFRKRRFDIGFDFDGTVQTVNTAYIGATTFRCPGCGDPSCSRQWNINQEVVWNGDTLDQLRKAFCTRSPDGVLWGDVWSTQSKRSEISRVEFFERATNDFLQVIDLIHAVKFAAQTTILRPGVRELMDAVLQNGGRTPILSNGLDALIKPLISERLGDLRQHEMTYCNALLGDPVDGYTVRGFNDAPEGIRKDRVVFESYPDMVVYCGDTGRSDGLVSQLVHSSGGLVLCLGSKDEASLWAHMQTIAPDSRRVVFIEDFTEAPSIIEDSGVLKQWTS